MRNLLYKELTLTIHPFFYFLPLLLSLLFFIPQWFFTLVTMYFFWITVPNVFGSYNSQQDYHFISMLPVSKKDVVMSKSYAFILIELLHIILAVVFGLINNALYGTYNFSLDINLVFFGSIFLSFGVFNVLFLPAYFKTAYKFGLPVIYGVVGTLLFAIFLEFGTIVYSSVSNVTESSNMVLQFGLLFVGITFFIGLSIIAIKKATKNFIAIN